MPGFDDIDPQAPPTTRDTLTKPPAPQGLNLGGALRGIEQGASNLAGAAIHGAGQAIGAGFHDIGRALAAPQQFGIVGPLLTITQATKEGKPITPSSLIKGSIDAVATDKHFKDVAEQLGFSGPTASIGGLVADMVLDPMWVFTPAKVGGLVASVGRRVITTLPRGTEALDAVGKATQSILEHPQVAKFVRGAINPDFGLPKAYAQAARSLPVTIAEQSKAIIELAQRVKAKTIDEQILMTKYMEAGSVAGRNAIIQEVKNKGYDVADFATLGNQAVLNELKLGRSLADHGIISEEQWQAMRGKHLKREYSMYEDPIHWMQTAGKENPHVADAVDEMLKKEAGLQWSQGNLRERLAMFQERLNIPQHAREAMGEIIAAPHRIARGQTGAVRAIETRQFLEDTAREYGSVVPKPGYVLADNAKLGPLTGKFIPEAIKDHLDHMFPKNSPNLTSPLVRNYQTGLSWWKYGKVVLSPTGQAQVMIHNLFLADLGGIAPWNVPRYIKAARSVVTGDSMFQEAFKRGVLDNTFVHVGHAMKDLLDVSERAENPAHGLLENILKRGAQVIKAPGDFMHFETQVMKMGVFTKAVESGKTFDEAAQLATRNMIDYKRLPYYFDALRRYGVVPFVTFPYQASKIVGRALYEQPAVVAKYTKGATALEQGTGMTGPQLDTERTNLPDWMKTGGFIRMPFESRGRPVYFNIGRYLPIGITGQDISMQFKGGQGFFDSPLVSLTFATMTGIDPYTVGQGRPKKIADEPGGYVGWVARYLLPNNPLVPGSQPNVQLRQAISGQAPNPMSRYSEAPPLGLTLMGTVGGMRGYEVDFAKQHHFNVLDRVQRIHQIQSEVKSIAVNIHQGRLTQADGDRMIKEKVVEIQQIGKELQSLPKYQPPQKPMSFDDIDKP